MRDVQASSWSLPHFQSPPPRKNRTPMRPIPHLVLLNENAMFRRPREQKTTDVGLEPTASALGGLRATIAPTGQILLYDKFCFAKINHCVVKTKNALRTANAEQRPFRSCAGQVRLSTPFHSSSEILVLRFLLWSTMFRTLQGRGMRSKVKHP